MPILAKKKKYAWTTLGNIAILLFTILAKKIIFSDETQIKIKMLGGYVNKQNSRIWDTENPHAYMRMIGAFFFENQQGEAVTVNGDRYRAMLN